MVTVEPVYIGYLAWRQGHGAAIRQDKVSVEKLCILWRKSVYSYWLKSVHFILPFTIGIPPAVVLERIPQKRDEFDTTDYSDIMLPEGIETVHPRFAISWRNKWMIQQSDYVVTYITHSRGGAAQFAEMSERQKNAVINLAVRISQTRNGLYLSYDKYRPFLFLDI